MSIKDTIKSLEEAEATLKRAAELEKKAVTAQRDAARLREEAQVLSDKADVEKSNLIKFRAETQANFDQREQDLKNREVKLAAAAATLAHNTAESNKTFETSHAALDARGVAADKADRQNREFAETLDKRAEKYKAIGDFISTTL